MTTKDDGTLRSFSTGATRDTAEGKLDGEGFTHPMVMKQFYKFMNMNRLQSDGKLRDSDNWQKGIDLDVYMKSLKRHGDDVWLEHRNFPTEGGLIAALCGTMFNTMGYLLEVLKARNFVLQDFDGDEPTPEMKERQKTLTFPKDDDGHVETCNGLCSVGGTCDMMDNHPEDDDKPSLKESVASIFDDLYEDDIDAVHVVVDFKDSDKEEQEMVIRPNMIIPAIRDDLTCEYCDLPYWKCHCDDRSQEEACDLPYWKCHCDDRSREEAK